MNQRLRRPGLALLGAWALASVVFSADENKILYPGKSAPAGVGGEGGPSAGYLVVGLAFAVAGGWLFWRNRRQTSGGAGPARLLTIAETRSLGNRQYLVVAAYENKKFLLGVCADRIEMLAPLHDEKPGT